MESQPTSVWLPPSHQFRGVAQVRKAVKDYDSNLDFGLNEKTNQWCVFLKHGSVELASEGDWPILGFPGMPTPQEATERLFRTDAVRRGRELLDEVDRANAKIREDAAKKHADVDSQVAEVAEWGFRHVDSPKNPTRKVFLNNDYKKGH